MTITNKKFSFDGSGTSLKVVDSTETPCDLYPLSKAGTNPLYIGSNSALTEYNAWQHIATSAINPGAYPIPGGCEVWAYSPYSLVAGFLLISRSGSAGNFLSQQIIVGATAIPLHDPSSVDTTLYLGGQGGSVCLGDSSVNSGDGWGIPFNIPFRIPAGEQLYAIRQDSDTSLAVLWIEE